MSGVNASLAKGLLTGHTKHIRRRVVTLKALWVIQGHLPLCVLCFTAISTTLVGCRKHGLVWLEVACAADHATHSTLDRVCRVQRVDAALAEGVVALKLNGRRRCKGLHANRTLNGSPTVTNSCCSCASSAGGATCGDP